MHLHGVACVGQWENGADMRSGASVFDKFGDAGETIRGYVDKEEPPLNPVAGEQIEIGRRYG